MRLRPYFGHTSWLQSPLSKDAAIAKIASMIGQPPLRGEVDGSSFWVRGGSGLGGLYPFGTGDVEVGTGGTRVRIFLGIHPVIYALEALVAMLVALWTASAIMAGLLHQAGILPNGVSWRPYAGLAALVLVALLVIQGHRLANREKAIILDRLRTATDAGLQATSSES